MPWGFNTFGPVEVVIDKIEDTFAKASEEIADDDPQERNLMNSAKALVIDALYAQPHGAYVRVEAVAREFGGGTQLRVSVSTVAVEPPLEKIR